MTRRPPTSQDVARLAGVSQSTVSYVLTGSRPISAATRQRVEEAIEKLGYHPHSGARALRTRRSGVIGLLVPEASESHPVLLRFVGTIAREARRFGYDLLLVTAQEGAGGVHRVARTGVCEGLILMEIGRRDERVEAVLEAGLPFVLIGKPDDIPGGTVVDLDFAQLGRMVVDRARAAACTDLLLFGSLDRLPHRNEVARFLDGTTQAATGTELRVVLDAGELAAVPERARALAAAAGRDETPRRVAVFGLSSPTEVLFAFAASGLLPAPDAAPADLADSAPLLISFTDEELAALSPLLAAVPRIDPRRVEISELAVQELVRLLRGEDQGPRVTLVEPRWAIR